MTDSGERERRLAALEAENSEDFQRAIRREITPDEWLVHAFQRCLQFDPDSASLRMRIASDLSALYARGGSLSLVDRTVIKIAGELLTRGDAALVAGARDTPPAEQPLPITTAQVDAANALIERYAPAAESTTDVQVALGYLALWIESERQYPRKVGT